MDKVIFEDKSAPETKVQEEKIDTQDFEKSMQSQIADTGLKKDELKELVHEAAKDVVKDMLKDNVKKAEAAKQQLNELSSKSSRLLFSASTVFPFTLFPKSITIDEAKINIILRQFFYSSQVHSISIKDVQSIIVETSPFFGTIKINSAGFHDNPFSISFLKKADAIRVKRYIDGLHIADKEGISLANLELEDYKKKLLELGATSNTAIEIPG